MEMEFVLLDESDQPFFSTFNEQELQYAMQFTDAKAEVRYYHEKSIKPYKREKYTSPN